MEATPAGNSAEVWFPLLENALDFLASGVRHLSGEPSPRDLKYAVLHLAAGIELVLKERLRRFGEDQVLRDPTEFNEAAYEAGLFFSVSVSDALRRLRDDFDVVITSRYRKRIDRLRKMRNRIQHFGIEDTSEVMVAVCAGGLGFALDFISAELDDEHLSDTAEDMLQAVREGLTELEAFVAARWDAIRLAVDDAHGAVVACPACGQEAAIIDDGFSCAFCGRVSTGAVTAAEDYATEVVDASYYETVHDGGAWVICECPSCRETDTMVDIGISGNATPSVRWVCFGCGEKWLETEMAGCAKCENWIPTEQETTVCGTCFAAAIGAE